MRLPSFITAVAIACTTCGQPLHSSGIVTRADTLRGSIGPERAWWDVLHYDVTVRPDFNQKSIRGTTAIGFIATSPGQRMQIDLQQPLEVDSVTADVSKVTGSGFTIVDQRTTTEREGNVLWVDLPQAMKAGEASSIRISYHGVPHEAVHPPWDGGWIWKKDALGNPWMSVACQGLGASVWYPCKDHQSDEPDDGAALHIIAPDSLQAVGNGRLRDKVKNPDGTTTWNWKVSQPINTYNLVPYIGKYTRLYDTYAGVKGDLDMELWMLTHHVSVVGPDYFSQEALVMQKAQTQFAQVPLMLACFEDWFGPYPFYEDGYKLVEAPHLGMEHQSAIAYGNGFQNGYLGRDLSGTGVGLKWDFIIIHESGHEWFGNSITTADIADMWVHEGFTNYSETIFTECQQGKEAAEQYLIGSRRNIANDKPIIGPYGVNQEGSGDMYYKGASLLHMIRHIIGDSTFKAMLREMNGRFYHKTVTSAMIEDFMINFNPRTTQLLNRSIFDQYLRTTQVPVLEWGIRKGVLWKRWTNCVPGLTLPVRVVQDGKSTTIEFVTSNWAPIQHRGKKSCRLEADRNWYVTMRPLSKRDLRKREPSIGRGTPLF